MCALTEKHARRAVELRHDNTLGTVYYKCALRRHIRNRTQVNILDLRLEILMVGVGTIELKLGFEGDTVGESAFETLLDCITRRIDIVIQELKYIVVAGIHDGEVFRKHLVKALIISFFGRSVKLQEILERLELHLEKVRVRKGILYRGKIYTGFRR